MIISPRLVIVGQQGSGGPSLGPIFVWLGVAVVFVLLGALALAWIRRRLIRPQSSAAGSGLSLHSLRMMRDRGELSIDEFNRARAVLLGEPPPPALADDVEPRRAQDGFDLAGDPLPERRRDELDDRPG